MRKRLIKKATLPILSNYYDSFNYDFIDIGIQTVNVDDIIGMTDSRVDEYNDDWTPKNENDDRWNYQKSLVESGGQMEVIPLIKTPDNKYFANGDGNHRISVAKVLRLSTVQANVSVMISNEEAINEKWEKHAKDEITQLDNMSLKYKEMLKKLPQMQDERSYKDYKIFLNEMTDLSEKISELDHKLLEEEKQFKLKMINN